MTEKSFNLRFTLTADIPDSLLEDDDFDDYSQILAGATWRF